MTQKTRLVKMIVYGCQMNFAEAERGEGRPDFDAHLLRAGDGGR